MSVQSINQQGGLGAQFAEPGRCIHPQGTRRSQLLLRLE